LKLYLEGIGSYTEKRLEAVPREGRKQYREKVEAVLRRLEAIPREGLKLYLEGIGSYTEKRLEAVPREGWKLY
jgi:hypothetical protein